MSTFCVLPFYGYETLISDPKTNIYCCRLQPGTNIESVRQSIRNGEKHPSCSACWNVEAANLPSERITHNTTFDYLTDRNITDIEKEAVTSKHKPLIIKLATSNICNSTCVTCGPPLSTAWYKARQIPINYVSANIEKINQDINWQEIVSLSLVGGEPLLEKENINILERLHQSGNTKCFVSIVTNGSIQLSENFLRLLADFTNLNICISIDGIGPVFDYLRFPLKWNDVLQNVNVFKNLTSNISVSYMLSNLNIFYHSQTTSFFDANQLDWIVKPIIYPAHFSPHVLSAEFKDAVIKNNKAGVVDNFLNNSHAESNLFEQTKIELKKQDLIKSINIKDYLPDIYKYLQ